MRLILFLLLAGCCLHGLGQIKTKQFNAYNTRSLRPFITYYGGITAMQIPGGYLSYSLQSTSGSNLVLSNQTQLTPYNWSGVYGMRIEIGRLKGLQHAVFIEGVGTGAKGVFGGYGLTYSYPLSSRWTLGAASQLSWGEYARPLGKPSLNNPPQLFNSLTIYDQQPNVEFVKRQLGLWLGVQLRYQYSPHAAFTLRAGYNIPIYKTHTVMRITAWDGKYYTNKNGSNTSKRYEHIDLPINNSGVTVLQDGSPITTPPFTTQGFTLQLGWTIM